MRIKVCDSFVWDQHVSKLSLAVTEGEVLQCLRGMANTHNPFAVAVLRMGYHWPHALRKIITNYSTMHKKFANPCELLQQDLHLWQLTLNLHYSLQRLTLNSHYSLQQLILNSHYSLQPSEHCFVKYGFMVEYDGFLTTNN